MKNRISELKIIEDRQLAEYFSLMAKKYMRIPCQRVLKRVLAKGIERGKAIDVGTGPGIFPILLSKALPGIQFKGIDLSPVMIDLAKRNAAEETLENRIQFEVGSAYSLPCEDHSIDLLLCINTLHHLDRPIDFFNEAGQKVLSYKVYRCWVSEYQALPDLDATGNGMPHPSSSGSLTFFGGLSFVAIPKREMVLSNRFDLLTRWRRAGPFWSNQN